MGYNIGMRIIDEFLAKANAGGCSDFKETGEVYYVMLCYVMVPLLITVRGTMI
jgi:hypothetical protein